MPTANKSSKVVTRLQKELPQSIIALPCEDKGFHEKFDSANIGNLAHPFRCILIGSPNCGKSTIVKNLVMHQQPEFDRVIVWHCDPETQEYQSLTSGVQTHCPHLEDFDREEKTLVIIDDVPVRALDKKEKYRLDRLFGNWSTHKNISVCLATQQPSGLTPNLRRHASHFCIYRSTDMQSLRDICEKCGCPSEELKKILQKLENEHDSLMIDLTSPENAYKFRKNIWEVLKL